MGSLDGLWVSSSMCGVLYRQTTAVGHTHIVTGRVILGPCLDAIGQEAKDCPDPQQDGETTKQLSAELDPFWGGRRRCEGIRPIPG